MFFRNPETRRNTIYRGADQGLDDVDHHLAAAVRHVTSKLNRAAGRGDTILVARWRDELERLMELYPSIMALRDRAYAALHPSASSPQADTSGAPDVGAAGPCAYTISSAKLAQAFEYLTQPVPTKAGNPEWMLAVTGLKLGAGHYTLEDLIKAPLAMQEVAGASIDMKRLRPLLNTMYDHGLRLHAIFHSHPSGGVPTPSGTDRNLQAQLETAGYPAIQAVFSRDGYVRFFSNRRPFQVTVEGKGVDNVEKEIYLIREFKTLPIVGGADSTGPLRHQSSGISIQ